MYTHICLDCGASWDDISLDGVCKKCGSANVEVVEEDPEDKPLVEKLISVLAEAGSVSIEINGVLGNTFFVTVNGQKYGYEAVSGKIEDLAAKFGRLLKVSGGKALSWLKKNASVVSGSLKGKSQLDPSRPDSRVSQALKKKNEGDEESTDNLVTCKECGCVYDSNVEKVCPECGSDECATSNTDDIEKLDNEEEACEGCKKKKKKIKEGCLEGEQYKFKDPTNIQGQLRKALGSKALSVSNGKNGATIEVDTQKMTKSNGFSRAELELELSRLGLEITDSQEIHDSDFYLVSPYKDEMKEEYHEPTPAEVEKYRQSAKKMIQAIKDRSPNWEDTDGSVEQAFVDNITKMVRGDYAK